MIPFDGDILLNSAMIPDEAGFNKLVLREFVVLAKYPLLVSSSIDTRAFLSATSRTLFYMILSKIVIS